ncbi:MAG: hypothetical protein E7377_05555, partial [Clostridiales bacterium]|nr:hypothetical protein [Clostridiales bacterium]
TYVKTGYNVTWPAYELVVDGVTVTAIETAKTYTVTYNANGGSAVQSGTLTYDAYVTATTERTGYTFAGWLYDDKIYDAEHAWDVDAARSVELTAQWTLNTYTFKYVDNMGNVIAPDVSYNVEMTNYAHPNVAKAGYTGSWDKQVDDITFGENNTEYTFTYTYQALPYNVTFTVDGEAYGEVTEVVFGQALTLPTQPTKAGYNFIAWVDANNVAVDVNAWNIASDTTLKPNWSAHTYNIVVIDNNENTLQETYQWTVGTSFALPTNVDKVGYTGDWNYDEMSEALYGENGKTITFIYTYTAKSYTVTLNADGGTVASTTITVTYDGAVPALPTPEKEGYTFKGWYYETTKIEEGATWTYDNEEATLKAVWEQVVSEDEWTNNY